MKKEAAVLGIIFVLLFSTAIIPLAGSQTEAKSAPKIGIYYYPWYATPWNANCPDMPLLGRYDSSNSSVIIQHLNWFEDLGINFIIFSWWGKDSPSDSNTALIVNQIAKNYTNIQYFIMVEPFGDVDGWKEAYNKQNSEYNYTKIYDYIYDKFVFGYSANSFQLDGKPAIGFYNGTDGNISRGFQADNRFTTRVIGCNPSDDWEYQVPNPSLSIQPVCKDGEISVCPRYGANGWNEDLNYSEGLYVSQWNKAISETAKGTAKIITIMSWNEFAERTAIEPFFDNATATGCTSPQNNNPFYLFYETQANIIHLKAVLYLLNEYNPSLHLIPETNESTTYWLASDNLLAYYALRNDNPAISSEIANTLKTYVTSYNLPHDSIGLPISLKHEALLGDVLPTERCNSETYCPNASDNRVKIEIANGTKADGWLNYADWLALEGISLFNNHQYAEANATYIKLVSSSMWNGYGFTDDAFKYRVENKGVKEYDTFKLGLALILAKDLKIVNTTFTNQCLYILGQCQLKEGGVQTYYNFTSNGQFERLNDSANAETTAITAIATEYQAPIPTQQVPESLIIALAVSFIVVSISLFLKTKKDLSKSRK